MRHCGRASLVKWRPLRQTSAVGTPQIRATPTTPTPEASPAPPPVNVALEIHGSNTIGSKLIASLLDGFLGQEGWSNFNRVPGKDPDQYSIQGVVSGKSGVQSVQVEARGWGTAFDSLAKGECDIGMSSRKIKPAEQAMLAALGDMTSPACEHVLAMDGIAIVVNKGNAVRSARAIPVSDQNTAPLLPSAFTVAREDYVFSRRLFLYTPANPPNPLTLLFIQFATSDAGQEIVAREGFVNQIVKKEEPKVAGPAEPTPAGDLPPEPDGKRRPVERRLPLPHRQQSAR